MSCSRTASAGGGFCCGQADRFIWAEKETSLCKPACLNCSVLPEVHFSVGSQTGMNPMLEEADDMMSFWSCFNWSCLSRLETNDERSDGIAASKMHLFDFMRLFSRKGKKSHVLLYTTKITRENR